MSSEPRGWVTTRCDSGSCLEAEAIGEETVALRSTLAKADILRVTREEWLTFVIDVKAGHFDTV